MNVASIIEKLKYHFSATKKQIKKIDKNKIERLTLNNWQYSFLPKDIFEMKKLSEISISGLTSFPIEVTKLKSLKELTLNNGYITKIPAQIQDLDKLEYLDLENQELIEIPPSIFKLKRLKQLYLSQNKIESIPEDFFDLVDLEYLYLDNNKIKELPPAIKKLQNLKELVLINNVIESIPMEVGKLTNLQGIGLSENKLEEIPKEVLYSKKLSKLTINDNPLSKMPEIVDFGIVELREYFKIIDSYHYSVKIDKFFQTPIQQYLLFFKDYVSTAKGKEIYFEVERIEGGLIVKIKATEDVSIEIIKTYLAEYLDFAKKNVVGVVAIEGELLPEEFDILKMNLELQVNNLNMQIKFQDWKIKHLNKNLEDLKKEKIRMLGILEDVIRKEIKVKQNINRAFLPSKKLKNNLHDLFVANDFSSVFKKLKEHFKDSNQINNNILIYEQKWNMISKSENSGLLKHDEAGVEKSKISNGLLQIINSINEE